MTHTRLPYITLRGTVVHSASSSSGSAPFGRPRCCGMARPRPRFRWPPLGWVVGPTFPSVPGDPSHVLSSAPFISFARGVMPPGMGNVGSGVVDNSASGGELQPDRCPPSFLPCAWRGWVGAGTDFFPPYPCLWATVTFHLAPALSRLISVELESTCGGEVLAVLPH